MIMGKIRGNSRRLFSLRESGKRGPWAERLTDRYTTVEKQRVNYTKDITESLIIENLMRATNTFRITP